MILPPSRRSRRGPSHPRHCVLAIVAGALLATSAWAGPLRRTDPPSGGSPPTPDSNIGFKLERTFEATPGHKAHYLVSVPSFFGLTDVADPAAPDPCDPPGGVGDGLVTADDILCDWWTSRQGGMAVSRLDHATQQWQVRTIFLDAATGDVVLAGDWTAPLVGGEAYALSVSLPGIGGVQNPVIIVGSHDPGRPCQDDVDVPPGFASAETLLSYPYHGMYQFADELLCGLARWDWNDADGDGFPDTCDDGIFDAASGVAMTVLTYDNEPGSPSRDTFVGRTVTRSPATGELEFTGVNYRLTPGDAYLASFALPHPGTSFCPPHF